MFNSVIPIFIHLKMGTVDFKTHVGTNAMN